MRRRVDPLALLTALGWVAAIFCAFVIEAPNRLAAGVAIPLAEAVPAGWVAVIAALGVLLLAAGLLPQRRLAETVVLAASMLLLLALFAAAGEAAAEHAGAGSKAARTSLGAGFWIMSLAAIGIIADALPRVSGRETVRPSPRSSFPASAGTGLRRRGSTPLRRIAALRHMILRHHVDPRLREDDEGAGAGDSASFLRFGVGLVFLSGLFLLLASGRLDHLSLLEEYRATRSALLQELIRHLFLVLGALVPALALGLPLGVLLAFQARWQKPVFTILNLVQTIPSMALFGLLMAPLAALGLPGIGMLPAVIALMLYALLPIVRNTHAGFTGIDPAIVETALGLGFDRRQLFWRLQLPLALPLALAGIRIALVQLIGLAVVAALIGAGGLGSFVFQGLGQDSIDRVLLGALPAIGLALLAYGAMRSLGRLTTWHGT